MDKIEGTHSIPGFIPYIINGIFTTKEELIKMAKQMSEDLGGVTVHYTYNGSKGILTDLLECTMQKLGIMMPPDRAAKENIERLIDENGGVGSDVKVLLLAHSQGGLIAGNLANNLHADYTSKIHLRTLGSASIVSDKRFGSAINYVSALDGVPLTDPWGYAKGILSENKHMVVLKPLDGFRFDHFYKDKTYSETRKKIMDEFNSFMGNK